MNDPSLEQIQMLDAAYRPSRPRLTEREAHNELVEAMARFLHYQDSGEPNWADLPAKQIAKEAAELPKPIIDRYRNDPKFRAQVDRAANTVLLIWHRCPERIFEQRSGDDNG